MQLLSGKIHQERIMTGLFAMVCLVFVNKVAAQADSIAYRLNVIAIQADFKKSNALFQLNKYKLNSSYTGDGQPFFDSAWNAYEQLFAKVPKQELAKFFTEDFYQDALYAAQLFRNITAVTKLNDDQQAISGKYPVHEDKWGNENHSQHKHQ